MSQPTAGKITTELLRLGILQETGAAAELVVNGTASGTRLGRPGQMLCLEAEHPRFLTIELGVSETSVATLPVAVELEDRWTSSFATPSSPDAWLDAVKTATRECPADQLWGVLVSVPGVIDETNARVIFSPNLHWLEHTNL